MILKLNIKINYAREFKKQYSKAPAKIKKAFKKRRNLFIENPHSTILNNHSLKGSFKNLRSINITGDWRAFYSKTKKNIIFFELLGTHSQLYK
ncbi:MAG: type II toxin-antitoxin system RelE/ParE family toxin [Parcubacteria group bacterium]|nr:type II toxin-antitoxin system RelE/ParE family toxin [Parcubacteria group bacterium]